MKKTCEAEARLQAWSLLGASRGSASLREFSGVFQVKTKIFPPPPLSYSTVHFCATWAGCRRYLCSEDRRQCVWLCSMWFGARNCGLCANRYLVPDQVTASWFLICERCIIEEAVFIWCFLKEELGVFIVSTTDFSLPGNQLSTGCRQGNGAPDCT